MNALAQALAEDLDAAFPKLVAATQDRVYNLSLALTGNAHDADDVAQDAYVRAYRALKAYPAVRRRSLHVRPWLAKIALNVWRNRVRGRKRDVISLDGEPVGDVRELPEARAERKQEACDLRTLLAGLPDRYRMAVVLRHAYDVPYAEAAAVLGIPVGTLKANVHRGTRMLRAAFARYTKETAR